MLPCRVEAPEPVNGTVLGRSVASLPGPVEMAALLASTLFYSSSRSPAPFSRDKRWGPSSSRRIPGIPVKTWHLQHVSKAGERGKDWQPGRWGWPGGLARGAGPHRGCWFRCDFRGHLGTRVPGGGAPGCRCPEAADMPPAPPGSRAVLTSGLPSGEPLRNSLQSSGTPSTASISQGPPARRALPAGGWACRQETPDFLLHPRNKEECALPETSPAQKRTWEGGVGPEAPAGSCSARGVPSESWACTALRSKDLRSQRPQPH